MIGNRKPYDVFYLIILIVLIFFNGCDTENNIDPDYENYYVRFFGDQGSQEGVDLIVNEGEQTVVLLGTTTEPGSSIKRIFLVKSDWHGNLIWKKKLGGPYDVAKDIELSNDGGFVILSESSEDTQLSNGVGFKLIKTTPEGEKSDSVFFKTPKDHTDDPILNDSPETVTQLSSGYVVTGSTEYRRPNANGGTDNLNDVMRIFFDENLALDAVLTPDYFNRSENDLGYKTVLVDQIFFTFCSTRFTEESNLNNNYNFYCISTNDNPSGYDFGIGTDAANQNEILKAICPTFSTGYFLAGTYSNGPNTSDIYIAYTQEVNGVLKKAEGERVIKIPLNTNRKITPTSVCQSRFDQTGYIIAGTEGEDLEHNIWLCKVSEVGGKVLWSSVFGAGDRNDDRAGAVAELPDGKILVVGTVNLGVNNLKMGLFKLNSRGQFAN